MNLVSDDLGEWYDANMGSTLPDGENAIYNAELTPLFLTRSGRVIATTDIVLNPTGETGTFLSSNAYGRTWVYWLSLDSANAYPSQRNARSGGRTLRCLVSTNNR